MLYKEHISVAVSGNMEVMGKVCIMFTTAHKKHQHVNDRT